MTIDRTRKCDNIGYKQRRDTVEKTVIALFYFFECECMKNTDSTGMRHKGGSRYVKRSIT